jgi:hypothetical protein
MATKIEISYETAADLLCKTCKANDSTCYQVLPVCEECLFRRAMDEYDRIEVSIHS